MKNLSPQPNHQPAGPSAGSSDEPYITIGEAAKKARVSHGTIRNRIKDGLIKPRIKSGKVIRLRWSDVEQALAG